MNDQPSTHDLMDLPLEMDAALNVPIDRAVDLACQALALPPTGGPSGRGWSFYRTAQLCPFLWQQTYHAASGADRSDPAVALQIGSLYHALQCYYYAFGLGQGQALYHKRGLIAPAYADQITDADLVTIPPDAADRLLRWLKVAAEFGLPISSDDGVQRRPAGGVILEAERIFDAHSNYYGNGYEGVTPLALEWFARHPLLGYTCRYDAIMRLEEDDPFVQSGQLNAGDVVIHERKSAAWLNEMTTDGWYLDGEVLGQLMLWEPSGCHKLFGPLAALVVDVVTKAKVPRFHRIAIPRNLSTIHAHERGVRYQDAEIALWQATNYFPKRWTSCWRFQRKCGLYEVCRSDAAAEPAAEPWDE